MEPEQQYLTTEREHVPEHYIPDPGPDLILSPGHDYTSVTNRIAGVVYQPLRKSPKKWLVDLATTDID